MYSIPAFVMIAVNVICLWMMVFFGEGRSHPIGQDPRCDEYGSGQTQCEKKTDSELVQLFLDKNSALHDLYLQKLSISNETAYAGSFTNIQNGCVEGLTMDYDSHRFPQYLIHSSCNTKCTTTTDRLLVLNLKSSELCSNEVQDNDISDQRPVFITVCVE